MAQRGLTVLTLLGLLTTLSASAAAQQLCLLGAAAGGALGHLIGRAIPRH